MSRYHIAFWNLENLFAPEGFAGREPWLAAKVGADLEGWSDELFSRKIGQLASVIAQMNDGLGPDILGVCEVEHRFCLEALCARLNPQLAARHYSVVHVDSTLDQRGIDTAFIFDARRFSYDTAAVFSHFVMRRTGTRDITQATFSTLSGSEIVLLCNHWPSRSGAHAVESQGFRMTAGETLAYWHERVREIKGANICLLAMGDFNDDPHDASICIHANASREREDVANAQSARLYNLGWRLLSQNVTTATGRLRTLYGTLYWDGNGHVFDQIMVSPAMLNGRGAFSVLEETMRVEAFPEMISSSKNEGPIRFGLPRGNPGKNINQDGFSDHFPVSILIQESSDV